MKKSDCIAEYITDCFMMFKTIGVIFVIYVGAVFLMMIFTLIDLPVVGELMALVRYGFYPTAAVVYGILSYKKTQKIIGPCLVFLLSGGILMLLIMLYNLSPAGNGIFIGFFCYALYSALPTSIAVSAPVVFLSSFATKYVLKYVDKRKNMLGNAMDNPEISETTSENDTKD